jgi:hypothetical protein
MGEIIMRTLDLREFCVEGNLPSQRQQARVLIWRAITQIGGFVNSILQVVPLISHIRSYPPHSTHLLHHPSLSRPQLYHHRRTQS